MLSATRKKLSFRAWHRGTREADLLMGRFADAFLPGCSDSEEAEFAKLLEETDPDIYDWITGRIPLPQKSFDPLLQAMIDFYRLAA